MCEWPKCKSKANYGYMECAIDDSGENLEDFAFCQLHANVTAKLNDDKDQCEWDKLTKKEKRRATQIVYRMNRTRQNPRQ